MAAAVCIRCKETRCAQHYIISMDEGIRWFVTLPTGVVEVDWKELNGVTFPKHYSAGGPGCARCRYAAATAAIAAAHDWCTEFSISPTSTLLAKIATAPDVISAEELVAIGKSLYEIAPEEYDLIVPRYEPPRKKRIGNGYTSDRAVVHIVSLQSVGWFPTARCAVDPSGRIYDPDFPQRNPEGLIAAEPGTRLEARHFPPELGGWGSDSSPARYTVLNGTEMRTVSSPSQHDDYAYMYWGSLTSTLTRIAADLLT
jgi:hypothetical protein